MMPAELSLAWQVIRSQKDAAATLYEAMRFAEAEQLYTVALQVRTSDEKLRAKVCVV